MSQMDINDRIVKAISRSSKPRSGNVYLLALAISSLCNLYLLIDSQQGSPRVDHMQSQLNQISKEQSCQSVAINKLQKMLKIDRDTKK